LQIKNDKKMKRLIKLFLISTCQLCRPDTYAFAVRADIKVAPHTGAWIETTTRLTPIWGAVTKIRPNSFMTQVKIAPDNIAH